MEEILIVEILLVYLPASDIDLPNCLFLQMEYAESDLKDIRNYLPMKRKIISNK